MCDVCALKTTTHDPFLLSNSVLCPMDPYSRRHWLQTILANNGTLVPPHSHNHRPTGDGWRHRRHTITTPWRPDRKFKHYLCRSSCAWYNEPIPRSILGVRLCYRLPRSQFYMWSIQDACSSSMCACVCMYVVRVCVCAYKVLRHSTHVFSMETRKVVWAQKWIKVVFIKTNFNLRRSVEGFFQLIDSCEGGRLVTESAIICKHTEDLRQQLIIYIYMSVYFVRNCEHMSIITM